MFTVWYIKRLPPVNGPHLSWQHTSRRKSFPNWRRPFSNCTSGECYRNQVYCVGPSIKYCLRYVSYALLCILSGGFTEDVRAPSQWYINIWPVRGSHTDRTLHKFYPWGCLFHSFPPRSRDHILWGCYPSRRECWPAEMSTDKFTVHQVHERFIFLLMFSCGM